MVVLYSNHHEVLGFSNKNITIKFSLIFCFVALVDYRDTPIPDTYIGIGHFWWYWIDIGYNVSI